MCKRLVIIVMLIFVLVAAIEQPAEAFYEGQTIEMLVPFSAGGGTDTVARFLAPFINQYVEGNPKVQVVNVPGGGSIQGANEFALLREHNGLNAFLSSGSTHFPYLLGESAVKYDFAEMKPIIGFPIGGVVYISPDTGVESVKDLKDADEQLIYAGISATGLDLVTLLSYEVLDLDVKCILGYKGRGPSRVAFEQGESNIDYQTAPAFINDVMPLVEEGKATPLFTFGMLDEKGEIVRDPVFPDLPTVKEVHQELYGEAPSGNSWKAYKAFVSAGFSPQKVYWVHGDAPVEAVEALKKASEAMKDDSEFGTKTEEVMGAQYKPLTGNQLEGAVKSMYNVDEETLDWVRSFLKDEFGVTRFKN